MKKAIIFILSIITVMLAFLPAAGACTVFSASDGGSAVFGNNEDWFEKDTFIWFVPASQGKLGCACVGFENAHPQGGINEAGLALDWVAFGNAAPANFAPDDDAKKDCPGDINLKLLQTCATLDDVVSFYEQYNDPNLGYASMYVADAAGKSAVFSWDKAKNGVSVSSFDTGFNGIGYGIETAKEKYGENSAVSADAFRVLLETAKQTELTRYSNVFDLNTGDIVLYREVDFGKAAILNIYDELKKGPHIISIASLFNIGEVTGNDVFSPDTLLPLYLRIIIYALGGIMLLNIAFMIVSLIRCQRPTRLKVSVRALGIAAGVTAIILLYLLYQNWYFIANYGFSILGAAAAILAWVFAAAALAQFVLCLAAVIKKSFNKHANIVYIVFSALTLLFAAALFASGFMH